MSKSIILEKQELLKKYSDNKLKLTSYSSVLKIKKDLLVRHIESNRLDSIYKKAKIKKEELESEISKLESENQSIELRLSEIESQIEEMLSNLE